MAVKLGLDVNDPFGRGANIGGRWPGGVMVYAIEGSLGKFTYL